MYGEIYEKSGSDIIRELGKRYGEYRKRMKYIQKEVAEKSGLSAFTVSSFENGSSTGITLAAMSPAYDLTYSVDPAAPAYANRYSLTVNEKNENITREDLEILGLNNDIQSDVVKA